MKPTTRTITTTALMTAVTCILAPISIPLPFGPVALTLGSFAFYLSPYILGKKQAVLSTALYLLIGFVGVPVFSGYTAGFSKLAGPSGGYLIGFLFMTAISGYFIDRFPQKKLLQIVGMYIATLVTYAIGTFQMSRIMGTGFVETLPVGAFMFLPLDTVKIFLSCWFGNLIRPYIRKQN